MQLGHLGQTRSVHRRNYLLHTPDTFIRAPLPGMRGGTAVVHAGPACGAGFTAYTAELESDQRLYGSAFQRFCYVLSGTVAAEGGELKAGDYAYFPEGSSSEIVARLDTRLIVIEKIYRKQGGTEPGSMFVGRVSERPLQALFGDPDIQVQALMPDCAAHDFAVNVMTFQPGASLSMVELHVMEHGLLMLEGAGIYKLDDDWHAVTAGDFIWMGPYCPQWFAAIGKTPASYLIYKDWNRHPL
jgi:(S)-ureidoglycine aminohydrolase